MKFKPKSAKERLILPLDVPSVEEARSIVENTKEYVGVFKIGMQLQFVGGLDYAKELANKGFKVFLDVKLHDIENTIERAVENIASMGVTFATIHAYPKTMRAAVRGLKNSELCLLGVTVLTSMNNDDLKAAGYAESIESLVRSRCIDAQAAGIGGIVCSPHETGMVRENSAQDMVIVTPGIRPANSKTNDQKRIATPAEAIRMGSDYLVVGRPITQSNDMKKSAAEILKEIESAIVA